MLLNVRNLHAYYDGSHVLQGVDLEVREDQVSVLLGRNGMGKTTLVRSIHRLTPPRTEVGELTFNNQDLLSLPPHRLAREGLALVPQGRRIFPSLSVEENLILARRQPTNRTTGPTWDRERVFSVFPRLRERRAHRGNQISGGEQQMLAIGRALMTNPKMLVMDEPSEGLAPNVVDQLRERIHELISQGLSLLLVEQNLGLALEVADQVFVLKRGQIVYSGEAETVRSDENLAKKHLGLG